jgi:hypothetical protein
LTLDKRVRKELPANKNYNNHPDLYFGFGRTIIFSCASVWSRANNSWQIKLFYNSFNVKKFASRLVKFLAYCLLFSLFFIFVIGIAYIFFELFGAINIK